MTFVSSDGLMFMETTNQQRYTSTHAEVATVTFFFLYEFASDAVPQPGWLHPGGQNLEMQVEQGCFLSRSLSLCPPGLSSHVWALVSSYRDTRPTGLRPTLMSSSKLNHF